MCTGVRGRKSWISASALGVNNGGQSVCTGEGWRQLRDRDGKCVAQEAWTLAGDSLERDRQRTQRRRVGAAPRPPSLAPAAQFCYKLRQKTWCRANSLVCMQACIKQKQVFCLCMYMYV